MGCGCGIPEPLRMCRGLPGHIPYAPPHVKPPLGDVAGFPDSFAHRPRDTRAVHTEVWGGPS
jgi:hypothetical protein